MGLDPHFDNDDAVFDLKQFKSDLKYLLNSLEGKMDSIRADFSEILG